MFQNFGEYVRHHQPKSNERERFTNSYDAGFHKEKYYTSLEFETLQYDTQKYHQSSQTESYSLTFQNFGEYERHRRPKSNERERLTNSSDADFHKE